MLGLCSIPSDDSGFLAAEALYGNPLFLPGEFLDSDELPLAVFQDRIQSALRGLVLPPSDHQSLYTDKVPGALALADFVVVCEDPSLRPLSQLYRGPFKVLACSSKFFTLQMGCRTDTVSIDRLKPVHGPDSVPQQLPWRGWPPRPAQAPVPVLTAAPPRRNPPRHAPPTTSSSLP